MLPAVVGIGERRRSRVPRWLVEIRRIGAFLYLSNVPGRIPDLEWDHPSAFAAEDITWDQGVVTVQPAEAEVDLLDMRMPLAAAQVHLTPDCRRFFEPMDELWHAYVRVAVYCKDGRVRTLVRGDISFRDVAIGYDGDTVSFRVTELWRRNEDFPPALNETPKRVDVDKAIESSEDQAYAYAFGNAWAIPALPTRSMATEEQTRQQIVGHELRNYKGTQASDTDPCPYTEWPHTTWPDVGALRRNSAIGGFYGVNRMLRLSFEGIGIHKGWGDLGTAFEGSFAQNEGGATQLESTANDSTLVWTAWNYQETLSLALVAEAIDGGAIICVYWNFVDADNHTRVEFKTGDAKVRLVVREAGVDVTDQEEDLPVDGDLARYTVNVAVGRLTVGVREKGSGTGVEATVLEFGEVGGAVGGRLAVGSKAGKVRFHALHQPSMARRLATEANPNASIKHFQDNLHHSYAGEGFREEVTEPLFYITRAANGVMNAGRLLERLIRDFSGVDEEFLDLEQDGTLWVLFNDLRRFRIGSYFNQQMPIFDLIEERLQKQFNFVVTQAGGLVRGYVFDPTREPELDLRYGVDLLQLAAPVGEVERYTRYRVRGKFFAPGAKDRGQRRQWRKKAFLRPEESAYLAYLESLIGGKIDFPKVDCLDVVDESVLEQVVQMKALLFHQGKRLPYLMRTEDALDMPYGMIVQITDDERRLDEQKAMFVGLGANLTPENATAVFRTLHEFEEPDAIGGNSAGIEDPPAPPEPELPFPQGDCWELQGGGAVSETVDWETAETVPAIENGTARQACECVEEDTQILSGDGGEQFQIHMKGFGSTGATPGSANFQFIVRFYFYQTLDCSDPPRSVPQTANYSGGVPATALYGCFRSNVATANPGEVKMRWEAGTIGVAGASTGAEWHIFGPQLLTSSFGAPAHSMSEGSPVSPC